MPFTFSHPAAILPLTYLPKRWFSLTGLVIGSITPDFEYFIRMRLNSSYSHTWLGLFWFDLPLAIIIAYVFHLLVRDKLIDNLPTVLNKRLSIFKLFHWTKHFKKNFIVVIVSCIAGIASHILWDSFTHQQGYFVQSIEALRQTVSLAGYKIPAYKILQHSSSLVGGLLVIYSLLQLPAGKLSKTENQHQSRYWIFVALITIAIVGLRLLTGLDYRSFGNLIVTAIAGMMIGLIAIPIFLPTNQYRKA